MLESQIPACPTSPEHNVPGALGEGVHDRSRRARSKENLSKGSTDGGCRFDDWVTAQAGLSSLRDSLKVAKFVVTALGVMAVGLAGLLGVWLRDSRRRSEPSDAGVGLKARVSETVRTTSAALAGGVVAGILVAGFGGRLLMRVVAVTSDQSAQGRLTEADEVVGRVDAGGTFFLVAFVGLFAGISGALALLVFRRFLPSHSWIAGLIVAGAIGGFLARPTDLLNPDSIDFKILGPRWFAAALGVALIAGLGIVGAELIDTFTNRWPQPALKSTGLAGLLPLLLLGLLGPGLLVVLPVLIVLALVRPGRFVAKSPTLMSAVSGILIMAGAVGWLWIMVAVTQIVV